MEKMNFVKDGVVRLPPGFRFHPTDEELVLQYLRRKVFSFPLPASIIPEVDVRKFDPWDLPGESTIERYFFSSRETKYPNGSRASRGTGSGYWKATGSDKDIVFAGTNQTVGKRKVFAFYRGKAPKGVKTDWIMHEYRLSDEGMRMPHTAKNHCIMTDWVLCRVFQKRKGNQYEGQPIYQVQENKHSRRTGFIDFMNRDVACSESETSVVTELSSCDSSNEETSSSF